MSSAPRRTPNGWTYTGGPPSLTPFGIPVIVSKELPEGMVVMMTPPAGAGQVVVVGAHVRLRWWVRWWVRVWRAVRPLVRRPLPRWAAGPLLALGVALLVLDLTWFATAAFAFAGAALLREKS